MGRDEVEAAYFALLRAREELDAIRRYEEYLTAEAQRLRRFTSEGAALAEAVPRGTRRRVAHTDGPLTEAVETRLRVIADELPRLPDRVVAAEAHIAECEAAHAALRDAR